ncbi:hypothetical protein HK096_001821 [Nowakowskiella sp. JEL0078]|nr:hypothetical protein HK096_001821 [Nowakowskiella sp. JEL0078]
MHYSSSIFIAVLAFVSQSSALLCDDARYPWPGQQPTFAINQPATLQSYSKFLQGTLKITGSIKILNGCNFQMVNIGVEQAPQAAQLVWYGAKSDTDTVASVISDQTFFYNATIGTIAEGPYFTLVKESGREISYYDFAILKLFSKLENNAYASATLTGGNLTTYSVGQAASTAAPTIPATATAAPLLVSSGSTSAAVVAATSGAAVKTSAAASPASVASSTGSTSSPTTKASGSSMLRASAGLIFASFTLCVVALF